MTGCLTPDGDLERFAIGDDPERNCANGQDQVSLKLDDLARGAATVPFFVTLRFGEDRVLAENGALELRARCSFGSGTSGDRLELLVTSERDDWFSIGAGDSATRPNLADDEVVWFTAVGRPDQGRLSGFPGDQLVGGQIALARDGSFIALDSGSTALGVNVLGQDCLVVGTATLIQGDLPEPRAIDREDGQQPEQISGGQQQDGITFTGSIDQPSRSIDQPSSSISNDGTQTRLSIGRN